MPDPGMSTKTRSPERVARRVERKERIERIVVWMRDVEEQVLAHRLARRAVDALVRERLAQDPDRRIDFGLRIAA